MTNSNRIKCFCIIFFTNRNRVGSTRICFIANSSCKISTCSCFTTCSNTTPTASISFGTKSKCISLVRFRLTAHGNAIASGICFSLMTDTDVISTLCPAFTAYSNRELTATSICIMIICICIRTVTNCNRIFSRCDRYITNRYRSTTCRLVK